MKQHSQQGAGHLAILLLLVAAAIIGFTGYEVIKTNKAVAPPSTASYTPVSSASVPAINNASGLSAAENSLNNTNLDQGLDPNSYNSDVTSTL